jgi:lipid-binding SYLF domain-containing protein
LYLNLSRARLLLAGQVDAAYWLFEMRRPTSGAIRHFFTLGGASIGLQFGGQALEVVLLVMPQKGVDSLLSTTLKLGADAPVAEDECYHRVN